MLLHKQWRQFIFWNKWPGYGLASSSRNTFERFLLQPSTAVGRRPAPLLPPGAELFFTKNHRKGALSLTPPAQTRNEAHIPKLHSAHRQIQRNSGLWSDYETPIFFFFSWSLHNNIPFGLQIWKIYTFTFVGTKIRLAFNFPWWLTY